MLEGAVLREVEVDEDVEFDEGRGFSGSESTLLLRLLRSALEVEGRVGVARGRSTVSI